MDLYKILGVGKDADQTQIRMAYRRETLRWHPDRNLDNKGEADEKFKKIARAYSVLSESSSRMHYDKYGETDENVDPLEIFKQFFEHDDDIPNIFVKIPVTLEDIYEGVEKTITYDRYSICKKCKGNGTENGKQSNCFECGGTGSHFDTTDKKVTNCDMCEGIGIDAGARRCKRCCGIKYAKEKVSVDIVVPKNAYDGYYVIVENEGNYIPKEDQEKYDKQRSDVFLIIDEKEHEIFDRGVVVNDRVGLQHLMTRKKISFEDGLFGTKLTVHTLGGEKHIRIPEQIRHGDVFIIKGGGLEGGDLYVKFEVGRHHLSKTKQYHMWKNFSDKPFPNINHYSGVERCESSVR